MTKFEIDNGFNLEYTEKVKKRIHVYPPHNKFLLYLNVIRSLLWLSLCVCMIVYVTNEPTFNTVMLTVLCAICVFVTACMLYTTVSEWKHGVNFKRAVKILKEQEDPDIQLVYANADDDD